jgi:hypothetical protein
MPKTNQPQYPVQLQLRVSEEQAVQVRADAEAYGRALGTYMRDRLTTGKCIYARTDQMVLAELRRIGGLIRHQGASPEIVEALEKLRSSIERA